MSETVKLSDMLKAEYVNDYVHQMMENGKTFEDICDSIVDMLYKIEEEEGGTVLREFAKLQFRNWVANNILTNEV